MPAVDIERLDPRPLGFGDCRDCAYRDGGSAAICFSCAAHGMELVGPGHCSICDQKPPDSGECSNYWCNQREEERFFGFIYAVAMRTGALERAINLYKYKGRRGWASIFGRVLVGFLDDNPRIAEGWDAIVACPTYVGRGSHRSFDHVSLILEKAAIEAGGRWPFVTGQPVVVKTRETSRFVELSLADRRRIAETELREAIRVPEPGRVQGRSFLVFDDVFTDGSTLREVARSLVLAGASQVAGLMLARQPWRQPPV